MNDPRRLLDGGGDPLEANVLRVACGDVPPPEGRARLLGAMGLAAATTTAAGAGTASGAMSGAKGALAMAGKWMVLGGMGAAVAAGSRAGRSPFHCLHAPARCRAIAHAERDEGRGTLGARAAVPAVR